MSSNTVASRRSRRWRGRCIASVLTTILLSLAPLAAAETAASRLGAGDRVDVQVWQEPDLSGALRIEEDGSLQHVLLGRVPAAGRTIEELAEDLRKRLERGYLRTPRVAVTLLESTRRVASVLGPVVKPGTHPVREGMRVLDLLVAAGGLAADAGRTATLLRAPAFVASAEAEAPRAPEQVSIDLAGLLRGVEGGVNPVVAPGDVLVVSGGGSAPAVSDAPAERVRVVGEVANPGSYALAQAPTLLDAVLLAGGLTEYAAGNRARLVRGEGETRSEERVRIGDLLDGSGEARNPTLAPGDLIVVPESFF